MLRVGQKNMLAAPLLGPPKSVYYYSLIDIVNSLQLLENIQTSVLGIKESLVTSSDVSNLERRLEALEGQAAENQFDLVRKS